jgi:hypothetical protein
MSLLRYEDAAPWANALKLRILERRMPPWLPEEGVGHFRGARGLSAPEVDLLVEWASGGAPRGPEGHAESGEGSTAPTRAPAADLVLAANEETLLAPGELEKTSCVAFGGAAAKDRRLAAIELWPDNESIVRSAAVYRGRACDEAERPLATWLPGDGAFVVPGGAHELLRRGEPLSARISYRKTWTLLGKPARDRSRLALTFAKRRSTTLTSVNVAPGRDATLRTAVGVVAVFPRGPKGATLRLEASRPGREREPLLVIERFDPDWRAKYVLEEPRELPAGARLEAIGGGFWVDYRPGAPSLEASPRRASPAGTP